MLKKSQGTEVTEAVINIKVNGENFGIRVQSNSSLRQVLHDKLGFLGVKEFCDRGICGACTVIMDGKAILSCMKLAIECDGKNIETIEGVAKAKHPLIEAYVEHHCMQCGYCTPGFIVTAKCLLDKNPDPTVDEIMKALAGNLCRCGTYPQHIKAVAQAAQELRKDK